MLVKITKWEEYTQHIKKKHDYLGELSPNLILFVASECINTDIDVPQQTDIIDAKNISPQQLQVKRPIPPKKSM